MTSLPSALRGRPVSTGVSRRGEGDPDARSVAARLGSRAEDLHPAVAGLVLVVAAYALLTAVTLAVGLVLGSSALASVDRWDDRVTQWFVERRTPLDDRLTSYASALANTPTVVAIAGVVALVLATARRWKEAALLVLALTLEVTVFLTATLVVDRDRPDVPRLDEAPPTSSFPSGHTAAAVALYLGLALLCSHAVRQAVARVALFAVAGLVPVAVGTARLYRGMHHPTDVFAGAVLGAACLALAVIVIGAVAWVVSRADASPAGRVAP